MTINQNEKTPDAAVRATTAFAQFTARLTGTKTILMQVENSRPNPAIPQSRRKRTRTERERAIRLTLHPPLSFHNAKFNVPVEVAQKLQVGKTYHVECYFVEVADVDQ